MSLKDLITKKLLFGGKYASLFEDMKFKPRSKMWHWKLHRFVIVSASLACIAGVAFLFRFQEEANLLGRELLPRLFTREQLEQAEYVIKIKFLITLKTTH